MKGFLMVLFLCLFASLTCKTGKEVLNCVLSKLTDQACNELVNSYKSGTIAAYFLNNQKMFVNAFNSCK